MNYQVHAYSGTHHKVNAANKPCVAVSGGACRRQRRNRRRPILDTRSRGSCSIDITLVNVRSRKEYVLQYHKQLRYCVTVPIPIPHENPYMPCVVYLMGRHPDGWLLDLRSFLANILSVWFQRVVSRLERGWRYLRERRNLHLPI